MFPILIRLALNVFLGISPTLIWLFQYLKRDIKPEPKRMIFKVFIWGCLITLPVLFVQIGLSNLLENMPKTLFWSLVHWFVIIAFTEEIFKYAVVRAKVYSSHHLDEPVDLMIYMIVAALGFAAIENIFYLSAPAFRTDLPFNQVLGSTIIVSFSRFVSAIFLHTLASGILGYFLALSFYYTKNRIILFLTGLFIATIAHGFFNFSIMTFEMPLRIIFPIILLLALAIFLIFAFNKVRAMKSVSKI